MADGWWMNTALNPSNWFGSGATTAGEPTSVDWSGMQGAGYGLSSSTPGDLGSGASGIDWSKVSSALKNLGSDTGTGTTGTGTGSTGTGTGSAATSQARSTIGTPAAPVSMNELVKALQAKSQMYMQQAINPQTSGQPVQQSSRYSGLLGF